MAAAIVFMTIAEILAAGGKITRTRFLSDLMFTGTKVVPAGTLSYMIAEVDGKEVRVTDAPEGLTTSIRGAKGEMINWAKEKGFHAKNAGLLDSLQFA